MDIRPSILWINSVGSSDDKREAVAIAIAAMFGSAHGMHCRCTLMVGRILAEKAVTHVRRPARLNQFLAPLFAQHVDDLAHALHLMFVPNQQRIALFNNDQVIDAD